MKRTVSALEARRRLGELLEGVFYRGDEVVIKRAGKVMAVVIPVERYATIEQSRKHLAQMIDEVHERTRDVPTEVLEREIGEAVAEVRKKRINER